MFILLKIILFIINLQKKNTNNVGRYEGTFKIINSQGEIELPLRETVFINVLDSISNVDFCCK